MGAAVLAAGTRAGVVVVVVVVVGRGAAAVVVEVELPEVEPVPLVLVPVEAPASAPVFDDDPLDPDVPDVPLSEPDALDSVVPVDPDEPLELGVVVLPHAVESSAATRMLRFDMRGTLPDDSAIRERRNGTT